MTRSSSEAALGQRIGQLRAARGWTQSELAERLAVSRVAVSHFEMGLALPSERTVVLLAGLFKLEPYELIDGTSYPAAKAERLPYSVCRYTEAELQLALLDRDLMWISCLPAHEHAIAVLADWRERLATLSAQAYDTAERETISAAQARLAAFMQPKP